MDHENAVLVLETFQYFPDDSDNVGWTESKCGSATQVKHIKSVPFSTSPKGVSGLVFGIPKIHTVDGRNPKQPPGIYKTL